MLLGRGADFKRIRPQFHFETKSPFSVLKVALYFFLGSITIGGGAAYCLAMIVSCRNVKVLYHETRTAQVLTQMFIKEPDDRSGNFGIGGTNGATDGIEAVPAIVNLNVGR